ncbi:MAG: hypothetical protein GEU90_17650 [Gemmatimonas sp.]|nr:hypothetical protein [Gemmatimonas sp.]
MISESVRDEDLLVEIGDGVGRVTMNRPETLNALTAGHFDQLTRAFECLGRAEEVRVVVLTGAGRAFSAGGDLSTLTRAVLIETATAALHTAISIRRCPKPVVAEVNGDAIGGGNEFVLADIAVAAISARLGQAGTRLGWAPVVGGSNFLSMSIGDKRAREVVLLSKIVPAVDALEWGWINEVVPADELRSATDTWCRDLILKSPDGLRLAKTSSNLWWDLSFASMGPALHRWRQDCERRRSKRVVVPSSRSDPRSGRRGDELSGHANRRRGVACRRRVFDPNPKLSPELREGRWRRSRPTRQERLVCDRRWSTARGPQGPTPWREPHELTNSVAGGFMNEAPSMATGSRSSSMIAASPCSPGSGRRGHE